MDTGSLRGPTTPRATTTATWWFTVLAMAAAVGIVVEHGEIVEIARLFARVQWRWLAIACALQPLTYLLAALIWQLGLRANGRRQPLGSLILLAFAMLFGNQALPTAGVSGSLIVANALVRRGVTRPVAMSALLLGLVTTYAALLLALAVVLVGVGAVGGPEMIIFVAGAAFAVMAIAVTSLILLSKRLRPEWRARLAHLPVLGSTVGAIIEAPTDRLRHGLVTPAATVLQFVELIVDATTFGVSLHAVGQPLAPMAVFRAYVMANVASRVAFVPLGIGTFETAAVVMLHGAGLHLRPAIAATVIFRAFTLWLPMLPGLWSARRALKA